MKILIADDHAVVRKGLIQILNDDYKNATIVEAINSAQVFQQVKEEDWDLILLDISMPGKNGIETLKQLRANDIKTPILVLSMYPEDQYAVRVLKAGASGYLNKESATEELLTAVQRVLSGRKYVTGATAEKLAESIGTYHKGQLYEQLSDREMQVLKCIAAGKTVSEIAEELSLSVNTISTYRTRILDKLSLHNNVELSRFAFDNGLV
jgi:DNA-binding NarL/FixJ family response regulator